MRLKDTRRAKQENMGVEEGMCADGRGSFLRQYKQKLHHSLAMVLPALIEFLLKMLKNPQTHARLQATTLQILCPTALGKATL